MCCLKSRSLEFHWSNHVESPRIRIIFKFEGREKEKLSGRRRRPRIETMNYSLALCDLVSCLFSRVCGVTGVKNVNHLCGKNFRTRETQWNRQHTSRIAKETNEEENENNQWACFHSSSEPLNHCYWWTIRSDSVRVISGGVEVKAAGWRSLSFKEHSKKHEPKVDLWSYLLKIDYLEISTRVFSEFRRLKWTKTCPEGLVNTLT